MERKRHPSGKPLRWKQIRGRSIQRIPEDGPLTPRLREERRDLSLIGFHHDIEREDYDEEE